MTHCEWHKIKLTPSLISDFGSMVFMECAKCQVIYDFLSWDEAVKKGLVKDASIQPAARADRPM